MTEPACVDTAVEYSVTFSLFSNVDRQEFHFLHLDPLRMALRWLFNDSSRFFGLVILLHNSPAPCISLSDSHI